jgi:3-deoxy-manno-octulosonate cytidylyltransferase (CMP-KDO synthetase)
MIAHVYERARRARLVDAVLVATDDERIADAVDRFGGTAVMTRADHASGTDRLAEVAEHLTSAVIVNVQGDEPLVAPEAIDAAIAPLLANPAERMSTLRTRIDVRADLDDPNVVKVVVDQEGYALYFTRSAVPYVRPGHTAATSWRHIGLYAYQRELLLALAHLPPTPLEQAEGLEQLRALEHGIRIRTVETAAASVAVDTPEDLERVRRLVEAAVRV